MLRALLNTLSNAKRLARRRPRPSGSPRADRARPAVEALEDRRLMTVTYHGGPLLQHAEVQALYYGSDWYTNGANYQMTGRIDGYLRYLVNSPYMDMLTNAGYAVGRGSFSQGRIALYNVNKSYYLTDSTIQSNLLSLVRSGSLQRNDSNRLYVIFVEPGVAVRTGDGGTSIRDFLGYHSAVNGVAYAVIPYQAGINASDRRVSTFDSITEVVSHEVAEAATDPMTNGRLGWFDDAYGRAHGGEGEIGDIVAGQVVRLNGYVVQKEAGKNDQALSPAGSTRLFAGSATAYSSVANLPSGWLAVLDITLTPKKGPAASAERLADAVFAGGDPVNSIRM